ncbi:L,D-transpeptidase [Aestuariibaculum suncheonense]|uniref:L,D-transpeptidase n=1 Tax=Aestuariibaculum suncheonense TaxID=1028745 RepID=A0A8J6QER8_9FLAO|nr:L,D-transpeptidase [Aestuariibaculum suncheonense]MBD0835580.1 L,D-transpeptidase [Aestuariibaculum suncheonense]
MNFFKRWLRFTLIFILVTSVFSQKKDDLNVVDKVKSYPKEIILNHNILVEGYFQFIDSLVLKYDSITPYILTEHLLVRHNPWILDTLQNTDYYRMKARDSFVYNQKKMIVLPQGNTIKFPDSKTAESLQKVFNKTTVDINIPEFKLRIYQDSVKLFECLVRVGRNEKKYLEMSGREEDLRTRTGAGMIVGYNKNPRYANPANNHNYKVTRRDDDKVTLVPQIPFIETELNGIRYGQLIHPTTNPETLGKAYSNGCIGIKEADAWVIYYYAPIKTKINIRYDLKVIDANGEVKILKDIYGYQ